ncbi:hypothetical protein [Novosphingobium kaempferiae]|uniref:hypothetical protein n=1 Tax=Novosphingobium kaempferiae TaxID=2896849 RepID=UPI001E5744F3|nr:hypothetical protein [Novosphingobium kaempferiae]
MAASIFETIQNFYTAITRARFGVKLWTENLDRLVDRLSRRSGEKTSALEGLGRLDLDRVAGRSVRHSERIAALRDEQVQLRQKRVEASLIAGRQQANPHPDVAYRLAGGAQQAAKVLDRWVARIFQEKFEREPSLDHVTPMESRSAPIEGRVRHGR